MLPMAMDSRRSRASSIGRNWKLPPCPIIALLDSALRFLRDRTGEGPEVRVVYFVPDGRKEGGAYETATGRLMKVDDFSRRIIFENGLEVPIEDIVEIGGTGN